jgi:hypothetical protein
MRFMASTLQSKGETTLHPRYCLPGRGAGGLGRGVELGDRGEGRGRSTQGGVTVPAPRRGCWRTTGAGGGRQRGPRRGTKRPTPFQCPPHLRLPLTGSLPLKRPSEKPQVEQ